MKMPLLHDSGTLKGGQKLRKLLQQHCIHNRSVIWRLGLAISGPAISQLRQRLADTCNWPSRSRAVLQLTAGAEPFHLLNAQPLGSVPLPLPHSSSVCRHIIQLRRTLSRFSSGPKTRNEVMFEYAEKSEYLLRLICDVLVGREKN
jgi:hypothetical protein